MIPLTHYLILSGILFAIGLVGVIVRRDIIVIFMCLEMVLSAANLSLWPSPGPRAPWDCPTMTASPCPSSS